MKKPNLIQRVKAAIFPTTVNPFDSQMAWLNSKLTIYPYGKDQTFIEQGYQKNWAVYIVIKKITKKFSQVPFYHYKIRTSERKTYFEEYLPLSKNHLADFKARVEMRKMLKKSVDQTIVNSDLSKFLAKPNRNQTGAKFRGNLIGHKLLTGEGNMWLARPKDLEGKPDLRQKPTEMFVIPKANLALVKGSDPWAIDSYKILLAGAEAAQDKQNVIMWVEQTYGLDPITLQHLRGQSPLDAWVLGMQGSNEAAERIATMNKNQGVSGLAWNEADTRNLSTEQTMLMRKQFNSIVNDNELAGTIAVMTGKWGFQQIGLDARALQLLEQQDKALEVVAMLYDAPVGIFKHGTTYENKPAEKKDFIYDCIAPAAYELRDEWNEKLLTQFNLDRERDVIDCGILDLPDLADDLKTQVTALKDAIGLTVDQRLIAMGYDPIGGDAGAAILIPSGYQTLNDVIAPVGGNLDGEMQLLNQ